MRSPSLKTIEARLGRALEHEHGDEAKAKAAQIKHLFLNVQNRHDVDEALDLINEILGGYGIEALNDSGWRPYYCSIAFLYVNMGDTYADTVLYDVDGGRWLVGCWGDIVETQERRFMR